MKKTCLSIALIVTLAGLVGCEHEENEAGEHVPRILVTRPVQRNVSIARDYVCQIHSNRHIEVRALERGYIQEVAVNEGQRVEAGQPMFGILPVIYRAELQRAEAEARAARVELENTRRLADGNVVSTTQLALATAKFERAQAEVELARAHLGFTEVEAAFGGIIDRLRVREGSLVEEGELLTTLSDNGTMWVYFNVPEAEYLDYVARTRGELGEGVELLMANGRTFPQPGRITAIEADFDNTTGTIPFRADFPNPEGLLRHGQTGNILMKSPIPDALLVPQKATFEILDHTYLFVVDDEGVVRQRRIGIRAELEDLFVVGEGLEPGERFVLEGIRQVRDGQRIDYEEEDPEEVASQLKLMAE